VWWYVTEYTFHELSRTVTKRKNLKYWWSRNGRLEYGRFRIQLEQCLRSLQRWSNTSVFQQQMQGQISSLISNPSSLWKGLCQHGNNVSLCLSDTAGQVQRVTVQAVQVLSIAAAAAVVVTLYGLGKTFEKVLNDFHVGFIGD